MATLSESAEHRPVPLEEDALDPLAGGAEFAGQALNRPPTVDGAGFIWAYVIFVPLFHLMLPLVFVPWLFSWTGLLLVPLGCYVFGGLGLGAGYHRLLTHRSFRCPKWVERTLAVLGVCSLQDTPARWVMIHRLHHQHADRQPDPHSPLVTLFWGHMGWLMVKNRLLSSPDTYYRYARDILQDPFYLRFERGLLWVWVYLAHALLFYLAGFAAGWAMSGELMGGVQFGSSLLLYGVIVRTVYTWHVTWGINSFGHLWGYRNYETNENSRNNWFFALIGNGEGWHNNHHGDPRSAAHGHHRWWEIDITYLTIRGLELIGLASDVVRPRRLARPQTESASFHGRSE